MRIIIYSFFLYKNNGTSGEVSRKQSQNKLEKMLLRRHSYDQQNCAIVY